MIDAWTLEKAAFAVFRTKLEDSYKRLLFLNINKLVEDNPNITSFQCYLLLTKVMEVERADFDVAVRALETPFKSVKINRYTRKNKGNEKPSNEYVVAHLNPVESPEWQSWVAAVEQKYPELMIWVKNE